MKTILPQHISPVIALLLILIFVASLPRLKAQDDRFGPNAGKPTPAAPAREGDITFGLYNGRAWNQWDHSMKVGYLLGYGDHWKTTKIPSPEKEFPDLTNGKIEKALDRFYATPENGNITIRSALFLVAARVLGTSEDEIAKQTEFLRKISACGPGFGQLPCSK